MPSPFGHALAGLAIGMAADPSTTEASATPTSLISRYGVVAAVVAASPDLDLFIRDFHRSASHSIGATTLVMIVAAVVTRQVTGRIGWRWVFALGAAHLSHLGLDWLGTDRYLPSGIEAFWPVGRGFYISGWEFFPPTERDFTNPRLIAIDAYALLFEWMVVGPALGLVLLARNKRRSRGQISVQATPPPPSA